MNECKHTEILCVYDSDGGYKAVIDGKDFKLISYSRELDEEFTEDSTTINYCPMCGKKLGE